MKADLLCPLSGSVKAVTVRGRDEFQTRQFGERSLYESKWVRLTLADIRGSDGRRFEQWCPAGWCTAGPW